MNVGCRLRLDRRLRDVAPGVVLDLPGELLALLARRGRADQHAVAARGVHRLDHQLVEVGQDVLPVRGHQRPEGLHVVQDRLLAQVIADDLGDERIDPLVVGHAGPQRVGQADVAGVIGADEPGDAQQAVRAGRSAGRGNRRRPGDRSRPPAGGRGSSAGRPGRGRAPGRGPRPARRPSAGPGSCARSRPSCTRRASARRRVGSSQPAGAIERSTASRLSV